MKAMQSYRLRFERWRVGIGHRAGRFVPFSRDIEAASRKAALKEAARIWSDIRIDDVSTRFVELIEIVGWAPSGHYETMTAPAHPTTATEG